MFRWQNNTNVRRGEITILIIRQPNLDVLERRRQKTQGDRALVATSAAYKPHRCIDPERPVCFYISKFSNPSTVILQGKTRKRLMFSRRWNIALTLEHCGLTIGTSCGLRKCRCKSITRAIAQNCIETAATAELRGLFVLIALCCTFCTSNDRCDIT